MFFCSAHLSGLDETEYEYSGSEEEEEEVPEQEGEPRYVSVDSHPNTYAVRKKDPAFTRSP